MKKINVIIGVVVLGIIVVLLSFVGGDSSEKISDQSKQKGDTGVLTVFQNDFDFGDILIDGGKVQHDFTVKNTGTVPVKIEKSETSCACTVAMITDTNGKIKGPFGMQGGAHKPNPSVNITVLPGEEITVSGVFDPLFHGPQATGKITRDIFLKTNNTQEDVVLKFRGDVVGEIEKVEGPSLYISNKEYDFGIVKQSDDVTTTEFHFINNGTETVVVEDLITSCPCTTATIDKKEIKPGEQGVVTVAFDANLHKEPDGRFFKTTEIVSNIKPSIELKTYAEVDYDLGLEALKSQIPDED